MFYLSLEHPFAASVNMEKEAFLFQVPFTLMTDQDIGHSIEGYWCAHIQELLVRVNNLFLKHQIVGSHGIEHTMTVLKQFVVNVMPYSNEYGKQEMRSLIMYAIILHDVDDRNYFPTHKNNENAREILNLMKGNVFTQENINIIIQMINLVSTSSNGCQVDPKLEKWMYIPRDCVRIESLGYPGVVRAIQFTFGKDSSNPLYKEDTPIVSNQEEYQLHVTSEKFVNYFYQVVKRHRCWIIFMINYFTLVIL